MFPVRIATSCKDLPPLYPFVIALCLLPEEQLRLLQLLHVVASLANVRGDISHDVTRDAEEATHQYVFLAYVHRTQRGALTTQHFLMESRAVNSKPSSIARILSQELQKPLVGGPEADEMADDDGQD